MQQTRLETDTLALGMAKEVDSAGVATVRTREGKMAAELRGAVPPVPGRATEPAPCGKDGLETNLGAAPAGGAPGKSDSAFNGAEIEAFMRQRYASALAEEAAEAAAEAAQLKAQLTAPPGLPAVGKADATVAVVTPPPSENGEEHPLEEAGDVPVTAGFLGYGAACKLADPRTVCVLWSAATRRRPATTHRLNSEARPSPLDAFRARTAQGRSFPTRPRAGPTKSASPGGTT